MEKYLLSFEMNKEEDVIEIHADERGLIYLKSQIDMALKNKKHMHLMTPNWGGNELSNEKQGKNNILINHVKIFNWEE